MELEASRHRQPSGLTIAGIPYVFTVSHVAEMLGEDEDWLREISVAMDPEEDSLWVFGVGEHGVPAFTDYGIECLKQIIIEERALLAQQQDQHK